MQLDLLPSAEALSAEEWGNLDTEHDPFISRAFLGTAEQTGAAGQELSWQPMHLALRDDDDTVLGMLPLYLRHHSFGDFSQDWHWPDAWRQGGLAYYPKLVTGVPFTPSPGPRLLVSNPASSQQPAASQIAGSSLIEAAQQITAELQASSWQCLFVRDQDRAALEAAGLLIRRGVQFHWMNGGYRDFDDFLSRFTSEKRKKVKKERRGVAEAGLRIEARHGDEIEPELWPALYRHYRDTFDRYGNYPAFSIDFFREVAIKLGRCFLVFIAWRDEAPVASAICYRNRTTLFGRHWGTDIDCPGLHFELCYYSGIEYAIEQGLQRFEPGAQGEHKLARGFEPVPTWSAFWIVDEAMRRAVAAYLRREGEGMANYQSNMATHVPFKTDEI